jgi:hypothetical protein
MAVVKNMATPSDPPLRSNKDTTPIGEENTACYEDTLPHLLRDRFRLCFLEPCTSSYRWLPQSAWTLASFCLYLYITFVIKGRALKLMIRFNRQGQRIRRNEGLLLFGMRKYCLPTYKRSSFKWRIPLVGICDGLKIL